MKPKPLAFGWAKRRSIIISSSECAEKSLLSLLAQTTTLLMTIQPRFLPYISTAIKGWTASIV
jgi:hypothetical protein